MKGLVISGGGADGPHTLGVLDALGRPKYDYANGVSTGALIVLMYQMGRFEELIYAYDVTNDDIYDVNLLNDKGQFSKGKIIRQLIISVLSGRKSLGSHKNLKKIIDKHITPDFIEKARLCGIDAKVGVHFDIKKEVNWVGINVGVDDYRQAVFSSTAVPLIMSATELFGEDTSDGGISESVGLTEAVLSGCSEVDVFMHSPKPDKLFALTKRLGLLTKSDDHYIDNVSHSNKRNAKNIFEKLINVLLGVYHDADISSLLIGLFMAQKKGVKVNIYWMPREIYKNAFNFNKKKSKNLYLIGKLYAGKYKETYNYGTKH